MACGCGGACCGQKGLGFLEYFPSDNGWEGDWYLTGGGGGDDWGGYFPWDYGFYEPVGDGNGGDFWGFDNPYWQGDYGSYYDPSSNSFVFTGNNAPLPGEYGSGDSNWQGLLDWWAELTGGATGNQGGRNSNDTNSPTYPGYCPGGYYHPLNDPLSCVPFPPETPAQTRQKAIAAGNAANAAAKAAQAKAQQSQGCPPNTGLVKNAQGQCVCPPPYQFSKSAGKCVLASQLTAADKKDLQSPDWLMWAILAGVAVLVVRR